MARYGRANEKKRKKNSLPHARDVRQTPTVFVRACVRVMSVCREYTPHINKERNEMSYGGTNSAAGGTTVEKSSGGGGGANNNTTTDGGRAFGGGINSLVEASPLLQASAGSLGDDEVLLSTRSINKKPYNPLGWSLVAVRRKSAVGGEGSTPFFFLTLPPASAFPTYFTSFVPLYE